jgi:glycosyltransferase involved in cell wall biosynthesis
MTGTTSRTSTRRCAGAWPPSAVAVAEKHNERRTVLVANPSADVYGADLQLLDSISGMIDAGRKVVVVVPDDGPLTSMMRERGAEVRFLDVPVLRRSMLSPRGLAHLAWTTPSSVLRLRRFIKYIGAELVYVNTMTLPWWITAARLAGKPVICHVHEAEDSDRRLVLAALTAPVVQAHAVIANSRASVDAMCAVVPVLRKRIRLIYNGVAGPPNAPVDVDPASRPFALVAVCRLSPRKAPDVAMEAVALLRSQGHDVTLEICGTPFAGYEWFEDELRQRASQPDLDGVVTLAGYVKPIWPALERAHAVVAPSLREPFGNAVIEGQLARRPVIASAAMGHLETVLDNETGLLVSPGDPAAMAAAVQRLMADPQLADRLARAGEQRAHRDFSVERYRIQIAELVSLWS